MRMRQIALIAASLSVAPLCVGAEDAAQFEQVLAAIDRNEASKVDRMLQSGVDPNLREDTRGSPTFLTYAALHGRSHVAEILIKAGAKLEAQDGDGCTALIVSARVGNAETIRLLLHQGASLGARCHAGASALSAAVAGRHAEVVHILKAAGATQ
jgi:uncharacterized protein